ncbi:MAG: hypothetical protein IPN06_09525 [Burkholderiales bacterium]|nr:hypothetical protein [Burkholderiales bacterium]
MDGYIKAEGFGFGVVGVIHLMIVGLYSKNWLLTASTTASSALTNIGSSVTVSKVAPTFGGGQMDISKNIGLRMEWDRITSLGDKQQTLTEGAVQTSIGLLYYFK